jgi:hypothetical protein
MSKIQESLNNIAFFIKTVGANKYLEDISTLQKLIYDYQKMTADVRQRAADILKDVELFGTNYHVIEDWLVECLKGNVLELPYIVESEYLKSAIRVEFKSMATGQDLELSDEDIEYIVDNVFNDFSNSVLNQEWLEDMFQKYTTELEMEKCKQTLF